MSPGTNLKIYQIETTNACNLRCHFCPTFMPWNERKTGLMKPELVDLIDWGGTDYVELQFGGEPLIHPDLPEIIDRVHSKGVRVGFSTNAHPMFIERLERVIDSVDILTVNDDDYRQPVFQERPNVVVQQLGITHPFEDYSRKEPTEEARETGRTPYCSTPFNYVSIMWNGDVVPCCKDHSGVHIFGNLFRESFTDIEHGANRFDFLRGMMGNNFNGLCEFCEYPNPHRIHERLIQITEGRNHE